MAATVSIAALVAALFQWDHVITHGPQVTIAGAIAFDGFDVFIQIVVSIAMLLTALVGDGYLRREGIEGPEFHVLAMMSASGAMMMGAANDLIVIFLGLEIMSIALYVLAAFNHKRAESGEAALKYFVLGAFSSAVFVYGIALVYGATGSTNLPQIADYLAKNVIVSNGVLLAGLALLLVGFGFKIAAVPFHMWSPDVYQGSPSPVTGFMAAVAKAGAFAALLRVFVSSFGTRAHRLAADHLGAGHPQPGARARRWPSCRRDVKRMMAYSSINHAGFILLGVEAATTRGVSASLYYIFTYMFLVIGSFAVITVMARDGDNGHQISDYRGLAKRQPVLALAFAVLLLGQAGVPFTTGFLAKFEVVGASVATHAYVLAAVAMVSAAVAAFFYLRVAVVMYSPVGPVGRRRGRRRGRPTGPGPEGRWRHRTGGRAEEPAPGRASDRASAGSAEDVASLQTLTDAPPSAAVTERGRVPVPWLTSLAIGVSVAFTVVFGIVPEPILTSPTRPPSCSPDRSPRPGPLAGYCRLQETFAVRRLGRQGGSGRWPDPMDCRPGVCRQDRSARTGTIVRIVVAVVALALLIAFVLDNSQTVRVGFVFFNANVSLIWVLLIAAFLGGPGRPPDHPPPTAAQEGRRHQTRTN